MLDYDVVPLLHFEGGRDLHPNGPGEACWPAESFDHVYETVMHAPEYARLSRGVNKLNDRKSWRVIFLQKYATIVPLGTFGGA
jgi:hypothetical protein